MERLAILVVNTGPAVYVVWLEQIPIVLWLPICFGVELETSLRVYAYTILNSLYFKILKLSSRLARCIVMILEDSKKTERNRNLSVTTSESVLNLGFAIQDHKPMLFFYYVGLAVEQNFVIHCYLLKCT